MKTFKQILIFTIILAGCISCKNKAGNTIAEDNSAIPQEKSDSLHQACGVVIDATMNGFTIATPQSDTIFVSTMNKEITLKGGLLLGDTLDVTYTITDDEPGINMVSTVKKVH